ADKDCEVRESPDGSLPPPTVESVCDSNIPTTVTHHTQVMSAKSEHSQRRPIGRVPAPFLRRRQGISAWCSKIRRQGLPVSEPAEELRKRHNSNTLILPSRASSVASARLKDHSLVSRDASELHPTQQTALGDECHNDAGDLAEFEYLEEIAENSSFSSLTTSFVAKLGKTSLKDRLKRAEEKLGKISLNDTKNCAEHLSESCDQNASVPETVTRQAISPDRLPERSILAVLDKHRSRRNSEQLSLGADRTVDGILAENRGRKVARFQFVREQSLSREDRSFESDAGDTHAPDHEILPDGGEGKIPQQEDAVRGSVDFDDGNSWTCSASDLNEVVDRPKVSSAQDLSMTSVSHAGTTRNFESQQKNSESLDRDLLSRRGRRSSSRSPCTGSSIAKSRDHLNEFQPTRRNSSRPLSANTHMGSRSSCAARIGESSYEDELVNLADDFVDQLKRDPPASGRSAVNTQTVLRQWVSRLEAEVRRFRMENATLLKMRSERDESLRRLEVETKRFEEFKAREVRLFTEMKENEMRKLK
ncbi:unnamed protein product, partial [Echinostoma caproni]|uniref:BMERB domain-containing protein n=1 Tax=Echinostoma caproni TaxID=27848 RepID=A0A183AZL5_9TREM